MKKATIGFAIFFIAAVILSAIVATIMVNQKEKNGGYDYIFAEFVDNDVGTIIDSIEVVLEVKVEVGQIWKLTSENPFEDHNFYYEIIAVENEYNKHKQSKTADFKDWYYNSGTNWFIKTACELIEQK